MKTLAITALIAILFVGCGNSNPLEGTSGNYGFFSGFWDGFTVLFAFIGKMFGADWNIYEVTNNGNWYNLGFLIGSGGFGILSWFIYSPAKITTDYNLFSTMSAFQSIKNPFENQGIYIFHTEKKEDFRKTIKTSQDFSVQKGFPLGMKINTQDSQVEFLDMLFCEPSFSLLWKIDKVTISHDTYYRAALYSAWDNNYLGNDYIFSFSEEIFNEYFCFFAQELKPKRVTEYYESIAPSLLNDFEANAEKFNKYPFYLVVEYACVVATIKDSSIYRDKSVAFLETMEKIKKSFH